DYTNDRYTTLNTGSPTAATFTSRRAGTPIGPLPRVIASDQPPLRRPWPRDPEPPHQRLQGRAFHSEPGGGAPRATEHPVRLPEDAQNVHPLHLLEGRGSVLVIAPKPTPPELGERNLERPPLREDHRPLDEV